MSTSAINYFEPTRLIFARQLRGVSRKQLADATGISRALIRAFEQRDYSYLPAPEIAEELAAALNFPPSWFYQDEIELRPSNLFSLTSGSQLLDRQTEEATKYKVQRGNS